MTKVFIDNKWIEYEFSTLYNNYGITRSPSKVVTFLDSESFVELEGWFNNGSYWVVRDSTWYSEGKCPYYVKSGRLIRYLIDKEESFDEYVLNGNHYIILDSQLVNPQVLYSDMGYTNTPSILWDSDEGVPWSWFNQDLGLYWNDRTHVWTAEPPKVVPDVPPTIYPNPIPLIFVPNDEMDPPISFSGLHPFRRHSEKRIWTPGNLFILIDNIGDNPLIGYPDLRSETSLYVIAVDGLDFQGTHYEYGHNFQSVKQLKVMVEPTGYDLFTDSSGVQVNLGYLYDSVSPTVKHYWYEQNNQYYTESALNSLGLTKVEDTGS